MSLRRIASACAVVLFSTLVHAEPVNINAADAAQLASGLQGVGASKAQAIVMHRTAHGPFQSLEELSEVKGIGASIIEQNRERMTLGGATRPADRP